MESDWNKCVRERYERENSEEQRNQIHESSSWNESAQSQICNAKVQPPEEVTPFIHITRNDFLGQKHKKLKEEDVAICECKYDVCNIQSACGGSCLNALTSTECTPGYCPCNEYCRNQKFQKCNYAKTKLFKTEGRGWGLLADENLKGGQFIMEYCGEVISSEDAKERSQTYLAQGLKDVYIISLNVNSFIDATKKGSLARFINHSCQPNCETRKWTVLGETRVGIFAKNDISAGTELSYDYNFEWYGGATVRCLCGAAKCLLFLGAKSHGFQEHNHVWEDGDDRYMVENIPLYDSADDECFPAPSCTTTPLASYSTVMGSDEESENKLEAPCMDSCFAVCTQGMAVKPVETDMFKEPEFCFGAARQSFSQTNAVVSNSACQNYDIGPDPSSKKISQPKPKQKAKISGRKYVSSKPVAELFASKEAQEEITKCEVLKKKATSDLNSLYNEIRPSIEEHGRDNQDSVPTSVAEKWIHFTCSKWKAEFDFHFSIVKNALYPPKMNGGEAKPFGGGDAQNEIKHLTN